LTNQQKQLLFDYCIGLTSEKQAAEAEDLLFSNEEAAELHSKLKVALSPLEALQPESCPATLAKDTIRRLNDLAHSSQLQLQQLLASEQTQSAATKSHFWWNMGKMIATAAVVLIVLGMWFAPLDYARQKYWQHRCQTQLAKIFTGLDNYFSDHDGQMPAVATTAGAPWWKVGYQGSENHSTTRNMYLLVKGGYLNAADFVCPGRRRNVANQLDPPRAKNYNDFPARNYVTYSFRIKCNKSTRPHLAGRKVLIADLNPLFEKLPDDYSKPFRLRLDGDLLTLNSINHNRHGQNVLFCDGSVKFIKKRHTDISNDDIFTLQEMSEGCEVRGCEVPSCETDTFLAP